MAISSNSSLSIVVLHCPKYTGKKHFDLRAYVMFAGMFISCVDLQSGSKEFFHFVISGLYLIGLWSLESGVLQ